MDLGGVLTLVTLGSGEGDDFKLLATWFAIPNGAVFPRMTSFGGSIGRADASLVTG